MDLVTALKSTQLSSADIRQLSEAEKGVAVLLKRIARTDITVDVIEKVSSITDALNNRDLAKAISVQTGLVNTDWRDHKDWLKGIKALLQLAGKKL
jgi:protein transport protein SEC31